VRAIWLRELGPPSVLVGGEADEPVGEVAIEVHHANIDAEEAEARGVTLVQPNRSPDALRGYTERALTSGLTPIIGQRFPLENAADAHAAIEARATTGKTLLDVR
jgi:hypothetical protein